eukprot:2386043-Ditylum_brightwellii.AAC.1
MEAQWIPSLHKYLQLIDGSIEVDNAYIPFLQQEHDDYIMDLLLESGQFTDNQICTLNYCRLHLQATTLVDLTLGDGSTIDPQFLMGQQLVASSKTKYIKINQGCPSKNAWGMWQKANKIWSSCGMLKKLLGL